MAEMPEFEKIAEHEIDDPVGAGERNGGFTALFRQRHEAFAFPSGHNHGQNSLMRAFHHGRRGSLKACVTQSIRIRRS